MNAPTKIILYFAGVLLLGALLSAPLYWVVKSLAPAAEARGWLRYETPDSTNDRPGWETTGWTAPPLFSAIRLYAPLAESRGWLTFDKEKSSDAKADRKAKDRIPPALKNLRKFTALAQDRGWFRYQLSPEEEPERDAKGWCAFLDANFSKVSNRAIVLAGLLLLWPLLRSLRIRTLADIGLTKNPHRYRDFAAGWFGSFAVMSLVGLGMLHFGVYRIQDSPPWKDLITIFISGLVIAFLEEWVFRGAILGSFRAYTRDYRALFAVSALFSILHFLQSPAKGLAEADINWLSGFAVLPQRFQKFEQPLQLLGGFTTLFIFGWVAGWAVLRTRGLALGMGFHAGMVFAKFGFNRITKRTIRDTLPWVGEDIAVGIVGIGVLLLVGLLLWSYAKYLRPPSAPTVTPSSPSRND